MNNRLAGFAKFQVTLGHLLLVTAIVAVIVRVLTLQFWEPLERWCLFVPAVGLVVGLVAAKWLRRSATLTSAISTVFAALIGYRLLLSSPPSGSIASAMDLTEFFFLPYFVLVASSVSGVILVTGVIELACLCVQFRGSRSTPFRRALTPGALTCVVLAATAWFIAFVRQSEDSWRPEFTLSPEEAALYLKPLEARRPHPKAHAGKREVTYDPERRGLLSTCDGGVTEGFYHVPSDETPRTLWLTNDGSQVEYFFVHMDKTRIDHRTLTPGGMKTIAESGVSSSGFWAAGERHYIEYLHTRNSNDKTHCRIRDTQGNTCYEGQLPTNLGRVCDLTPNGSHLLFAYVRMSPDADCGNDRSLYHLAIWSTAAGKEVWRKNYRGDGKLVAPTISGDGRQVAYSRELINIEQGTTVLLPLQAMTFAGNDQYLLLLDERDAEEIPESLPWLKAVPLWKRLRQPTLLEQYREYYPHPIARPCRLALFDCKQLRIVKHTQWILHTRNGDWHWDSPWTATISPTGNRVLMSDVRGECFSWRIND
ncbi:MAG: hypothetical protein SFU86_19345 [Pirellulaceae bacterium]|nr:hypothetical protein [Pirellulaceae bacterium]